MELMESAGGCDCDGHFHGPMCQYYRDDDDDDCEHDAVNGG